ncbi:MAG: FkbM family methyltransferase [Verrucomicrobiota bacterium]
MRKLLLPRYLLQAVLSIPQLGIVGSLKLLVYRYIKGTFTLQVRNLPSKLKLRGATSDLSVVYTIACHKDYAFPEIRDVDHVLDCGAYIGISTIQLKHELRAQTVTAVEPDPDNFSLLEENCKADPAIRCIHGAIWKDKSPLHIINPGDEKWGFQCAAAGSEADAGSIKSYTVGELLAGLPAGRVLVKMDIEGAEKEVYRANPEWLGRIDYLIMEIHPGCWKAVFDAMSGYDYDCRFSGENILFIFSRPSAGSI